MYKIMFVDDEEQNLFLMEKIVDWEEMGFRVCGLALDGPEGIQVFEETEPDVVFVDIRMDEMDGLTLIEKLQKKEKKAVFVIVTAYDEFSYAQRAIMLGAKNYLLKPISRKEMIPMVMEIKEELDAAKEKEDQNRYISKRYETGVLQKSVFELEERCLKRRGTKQEILEKDDLDIVIRGRSLRSIILFSPNENTEELLGLMEEWPVEYCFPMYDGVYGVIRDTEKREIEEIFGMLTGRHMKKKYLLHVGSTFSSAEEFRKCFVEDFPYRNSCFYCTEHRLYESKKMKYPAAEKYLRYEEEPMGKLIYSASANETIAMVNRMTDYAQEQNSAPVGLIDEMIEILIFIKSQLTKLYQDRAFLVLRHQNIWNLYKIRTKIRLLSEMENILNETAEGVQNILDNKGNYSLIGKTTEYISQHYSDPEFAAGEVAEAVHLSRNYFLKVFKEETGSSFMDYVTNIRMENAKRLLKTTDLTVYAISREVGYESQYHFSRKFKNLYGISPNEYRNL